MPKPITRPLTLIVEVEAGQPVKIRVRHDRPEEEALAYRLAAEAARLTAPLRSLMALATDRRAARRRGRPAKYLAQAHKPPLTR